MNSNNALKDIYAQRMYEAEQSLDAYPADAELIRSGVSGIVNPAAAIIGGVRGYKNPSVAVSALDIHRLNSALKDVNAANQVVGLGVKHTPFSYFKKPGVTDLEMINRSVNSREFQRRLQGFKNRAAAGWPGVDGSRIDFAGVSRDVARDKIANIAAKYAAKTPSKAWNALRGAGKWSAVSSLATIPVTETALLIERLRRRKAYQKAAEAYESLSV